MRATTKQGVNFERRSGVNFGRRLTLEINSKLASSLYGRGLAKLKKGDRVGAHADMAAAKAINTNIAQELARYGIK